MTRAFTGQSARLPSDIGFRTIRDDDLEFLQSLYASTRKEELHQVPWDEAKKDQFLDMQFRAQHQHYQDNYPNAEFLLIEQSGEAVGRVYLDRRDDEFRLIDIALLPEHRNQGWGGAMMQDLLDEAREASLPVTIHVESFNPAFRLYQRLGFEIAEDRGVYQFMRWLP